MQQVSEYRLDFSLIRKPVIFSACLLFIGSVLFALSWRFYSVTNVNLQHLGNDLRSVRQQVQESRSLENMIDSYRVQFKELSEKNYFGGDRKLSWLESIKDSTEQFGLFDTKYVIGKQLKLEQQEYGMESSLGVYTTPVKLEFGLLHEGDLPKVFDFLRDQSLGLFSVDACSIDRASDQTATQNLHALVNVRCEFTSYSFVCDDKSSSGTDNDYAMVGY